MIDTHCHLTDERLGSDAEEIIKNMKADGLDALVTIGYDSDSSEKCAEIAASHENVYATAGLQPEELDHETDLGRILPLLHRPGVVALGEIGLDYHDHYAETKDIQKKFFINQLDIACAEKMPVVIHSRSCDGDMLPILKSYAKKLTACEIHCFSSSAEIAREYVKLGFYIAFGGACTFKNANKGEAIRAVPDDLILAETDSPYLAPVPHRGERNEPKYVRYVLEKLALERNTTFERINELTVSNAKRLFGLK